MSSGDRRFYLALGLLCGSYLVLLIAMLVADLAFTTPHHLWAALQTPEIRFHPRRCGLQCSSNPFLSTMTVRFRRLMRLSQATG